jgi:hypothetical protein
MHVLCVIIDDRLRRYLTIESGSLQRIARTVTIMMNILIVRCSVLFVAKGQGAQDQIQVYRFSLDWRHCLDTSGDLVEDRPEIKLH